MEQLRDEPTEARDTIREFIKDGIKEQAFIAFHEDDLFLKLPGWVSERLKRTEIGDTAFLRLVQVAADKVARECPGLKIHVMDNLYGVHLSVSGMTEWRDVITYAHEAPAEVALKELSPVAAELLERLEGGEFDEPRSELSVRHRLRFFGYSSNFERLIEEIRLKRGIEIQIEHSGDRWMQKSHKMRITIVARHDPVREGSGYNPKVPADVMCSGSFREFQRWFFSTVAAAPFAGDQPEKMWAIKSRKEFVDAFGEVGATLDTKRVVNLLQAVRTSPLLKVGYNFSSTATSWTVTVAPIGTWEQTRVSLRQQLSQKTPEEEFGLSSKAAVLYEWIRQQQTKGLELGLTDVVEDAIGSKVLLLENPWEAENFRLFLSLVSEEVTDRTKLRVSVVDWIRGGQRFCRLRVGPGD